MMTYILLHNAETSAINSREAKFIHKLLTSLLKDSAEEHGDGEIKEKTEIRDDFPQRKKIGARLYISFH